MNALTTPEAFTSFPCERCAKELASHIAPWDTLTEVRRIAAARGEPVNEATAQRAMELVREQNVPNDTGLPGWGPT